MLSKKVLEDFKTITIMAASLAAEYRFRRQY
jgi:hypothetical protein